MSADTTTEPASPGPSRTRRVGAVSTLFIAVFLAMLDLSVVNVALPSIGRDLDTDLAGLQWVVDSYTLAFAGLLLIGGLVGDRFGHRAGYLGSMLLFVLGAAICALAGSLPVLLAGRAIQGLAAAVLVPGSLALIVHTFPDPRTRAKVIGAWSGLNGVAIAAGPVLGGWLTGTFGWPAVFVVNLPLGLLALAVATRTLPYVPPGLRNRPLDLAGLVWGLVWTTALAFALIEGAGLGWTSPPILAAFAVAVAGLIAFLTVERHGEHRLVPMALFRVPSFAGAIAVAFVIGFSLSSLFFFLSLYFQRVQGFSEVLTGLAFVPAALAMVIGSPMAGRVIGSVGQRWPMIVGLALGATGLGSLSTLEPDSPYSSIWWMLVIVGLGVSASIPAANSAALARTPPERAGAGSATVEAAQQFGLVFGIAVLGTLSSTGFVAGLADRFDALASPSFALGLRLAFGCAAVVAVLGAVVALLLVRPTRRETVQASPGGRL